MKINLFILLLSIVMNISTSHSNNKSPNFPNYEKEWRKVQEFESQGLIKDALLVVKEILEKAMQEKNSPQIYKSLLYFESFTAQGDEKGLSGIIYRLEGRLPILYGVEKALIQTILGQLYWNVYRSNSNAYGEKARINTSEQDSLDINTWTASSLIEKSNEYFLISVQEPALKNIKVSTYNEILNLGNDSLQRPYLYDILLQRAIDHFTQSQSSLPNFRNSLNTEQLLSTKYAFLKLEFLDKQDPQLQVFRLYQEAILYHMAKNNMEAVHHADMSRLQYAYQFAQTLEGKKKYVELLHSMIKEEKVTALKAQIMLTLADFYIQQSDPSLHTSTITKNNFYPKADSLLKEANKLSKKTMDNSTYIYLKNLIEQQSIQVQVEKVQLPNEAFKGWLKYRNIGEVSFKLYKIDNKDLFRFQFRNQNKILDNFKNTNPLRSWVVKCNNPGDFIEHAFEFKMDPLDLGAYFIFASTSSQLNDASTNLYGTFFQVSNLSSVVISDKGQESWVYVLHRKSGLPIEKSTINLFNSIYNNKSHEQEWKLISTSSTDSEGKVKFGVKTQGQITISKGKDTLWPENWIANYEAMSQESYNTCHFFTDRSIYRPGQNLYVKCLITNQNALSVPTILPKKNLTIKLRNPNGQIVDEKKLTTNEYGSASSSFAIPSTGMNGNYYLESSLGGGLNIKVEEYKRPNFEVKIDTLNTGYQIDDQIEITGTVKSFNGISISDAQLRYRVYREEVFSYFPCWYRWYFPSPQREELVQGIGQTDKKGLFQLQFKALGPDREPTFYNRTFRFVVDVDVTDLTGETQSGNYSLDISEAPFLISTNLQNILILQNLPPLKVNTLNTASKEVPSTITVQIIELESPKHFLRKRYWSAPDQFIYSYSDFKKWFPLDVYNQEDQPNEFKERKTLYEQTIATKGHTDINLVNIVNKPGYYKVYIKAISEAGKKVELTDYFQLLSENKSNDFASPYTTVSQSTAQPGQKVKLSILPIASNYSTLLLTNRSGEKASLTWMKGTASNKEFLISEKDRGGLFMQTLTVYNNRLYTFDHTVEVPWTNKELIIRTESFQDRILPGSKEEWSFVIEDKSASPVIAECIASMYDASLDKIYPHSWVKTFYPIFSNLFTIQANTFGIQELQMISFVNQVANDPVYLQNTYLNTFNLPMWNQYGGPILYGRDVLMDGASPPRQGMPSEQKNARTGRNDKEETIENSAAKAPDVQLSEVNIRKNFAENVFFYPNLSSGKDGKVKFTFIMNDALTKWKLQLFAHTLDLKYGFQTFEVISYKPIQVYTYLPRFVRQTDEIELMSKVSNATDQSHTASVKMTIIDALTLKDITMEFLKVQQQKVSLTPLENKTVSWKLSIPANEQRLLKIRSSAETGQHTDAEENLLPVLSNRKNITHTLPLPIGAQSVKSFDFKIVEEVLKSPTASIQNYTIELTSHPVWFAIQSLPYLIEYPYECSEQIMSRVFANTLAESIMNNYPRVKQVMDNMLQSKEFISPLSKNQELKSALLEETPWISQALSETQQMKEIALLMDFNKMAQERKSAIQKLMNLQLDNGGFNWFPGGPPDYFITLQIVMQIGQLKKLGMLGDHQSELYRLVNKAIPYLNYSLLKSYKELENSVKAGKTKWDDQHLSYDILLFLYARTFFESWETPNELKKPIQYYLSQTEKFWKNDNIYWEGLCAIVLGRNNNHAKAQLICKSLAQRAIRNEELGTYWKSNWSYYWYQLPVESQSLMIEVFSDIAKDQKMVDELKTWLLKNKQTNHWPTSKATTSAIYALLSTGTDWAKESLPVNIELGNIPVFFEKEQLGTGYSKKSFRPNELNSSFAKIKLTNPNKSVAWGAAYLQYSEQLNKISASNTSPLRLQKEYYIKTNTPKGVALNKIDEKQVIKVGDRIVSRIIIKVDRPMEYIHLKEMRGAGLNVAEQLSEYKWQGSLSFYQSPRDLSTDFFISYLPPGTHVIEYDLLASHAGHFANGISTIQSMYAPEFSASTISPILVIK